MGNIKGFKSWINNKYNRLHQELSAELRMMVKSSIGETLNCNYRKHLNHKDYSYEGFDILCITEITLKDNNPLFKGEIIYDNGEFEKVEYEITELTADEIFDIIMSIKE
jgi:mRNA deadenylase 3'-5' endonuclease subunit Ccr4